MFTCYYLLYKLNNSNILWIINVMDIPDELSKFIKK